VSRLVKRKGIDTVLKALPEVLEVVPNVQYVVIGDGPEIANCKLLIVNCKLEHHVQFLGQLSDEERTVWYKRADVFVLVPRRIKGDVEGFGTVYLEANSFGLPVIGSRTGGVPEAVKHGESGLLVEPDDPKETAQAIIKLLTNKQLASKLGRQGKERVISEFQWEKQIQKVVNAEL
jgi:phosphatidylinositol alpha-1,6-mannosyltransferase